MGLMLNRFAWILVLTCGLATLDSLACFFSLDPPDFTCTYNVTLGPLFLFANNICTFCYETIDLQLERPR